MTLPAASDSQAVPGQGSRSADHRRPPAFASLDAAVALAPELSHEHAAQETVRLLQRIGGVEAVAVAVGEGEEAPPAVVARSGFPTAEAAQMALDAAWARRRAHGESRHRTGAHVETYLPIGTGETATGALLVVSEPAGDAELDEIARQVEAVAPHLAVAFERSAAVRRLEQRLRLDAVGEVAAGLAHELRNPLFGISSAAQLLRYRVTEDPVVERNVGRILREVERLNTMVAALLEYGRPSPFRFEAGDPDAVWDDVLRQQQGRLESKALRVRRVRGAAASHCMIDAGHLAQAFVNLLDNAIDAAPEGTDLTLESSLLPSGAWQMTLANGGPAVAPDVVDRAFDLFFSTKSGGTGVGLPLCRRIVEEHRGTLLLRSGADGGAAVVLTLPGRAEDASGVP